MEDSSSMVTSTKPQRQLGFFVITALVMGNMIGSGVFLLPSTLAPYGHYALSGWVLSAVGAMLLAFVFARLSYAVPQQGGIYAFSRKAFGDFVGFQVAWNYWVQTWVGNSALVIGSVAYMASLWPELGTNKALAVLVGLGILWGITGINLMSLRLAGTVQTVSTVLKLVPVLLIAGIGIFYINPENLLVAPMNSETISYDAINKVALLTMWSFIGVESAGVPAGAIKNPKRTIPMATLVGTGLTAIIYLVSLTAMMGVIPQGELASSTAPYALAANYIFGAEWGSFFKWFVTIGAVMSSLGALNGWILLQGQMPLAAAQDKLFPSIFGKLRNGVPYFGILVSSVLISGLLLMGMQDGLIKLFEFVISLATLTVLICYLFGVVSQMVMAYTGQIAKEQVSWMDKVVSLGAFVYILYAMYGAGEALISLGALFFFASTPVYALVAKQRREVEKND